MYKLQRDIMKARQLSILLIFATLIFSCSKDSESGAPETANLIIGEWFFMSENDYRCGTDVVVNERLGTDNESESVDNYNADGTWASLDTNGNTIQGEGGTWRSLENNNYEIYFEGDMVTQNLKIEFDGNNVMKYNMDEECFGVGDESRHTYSVYNRR